MVGPRCFLLGPTKTFSSQNGEKTEMKNWTSWYCGWACPHWSSSFFFSFFLFLSFGCFLFFFSFDLQGRLCKRLVLIYFFFLFLLLSFIFLFLIFWFIYLFRCDFFFQTWFLFFNKFRWLIFFLVVYHFFGFNWASFFNKGMCINLYKLTFSSLLLFHS